VCHRSEDHVRVAFYNRLLVETNFIDTADLDLSNNNLSFNYLLNKLRSLRQLVLFLLIYAFLERYRIYIIYL
jgi:hypothetical protein